VPTYNSLDELLEVGRDVVSSAIDNHALDIQAELIQDFFWMRLDYPEETHHHFSRYDAPALPTSMQSHQDTEKFNYAV